MDARAQSEDVPCRVWAPPPPSAVCVAASCFWFCLEDVSICYFCLWMLEIVRSIMMSIFQLVNFKSCLAVHICGMLGSARVGESASCRLRSALSSVSSRSIHPLLPHPHFRSYKVCTGLDPLLPLSLPSLSLLPNMLSISRLLTTCTLALAASRAALAISPGFPYGSEKVRGVNLGGWLVLCVFFSRVLFYPVLTVTNSL